TVVTSAANLGISPLSLRLGAGQYDPNDYVSSPQYLNNPVSVTLTSSDPTTVTVPSPIVMPSGSYYQYFSTTALIPGTATVTASAPSWASATRSVRVTTPKLGVSGGTTLNTTSPASSFTVYAEDSTLGVHYRTNALAVTVSSSDPTVFTVNSSSLTIPAGQQYVTTGNVTPVGGGSAWLKVTASGHIADSTLYTVVGPKLSFSWTSNLIGLGQIDQNLRYVQGPNYVTSPLTVSIANPHASIVSVPSSVIIPTSNYYVYFDVQGAGLGKDTLIASAPGYQPDTAVYTVTTPRLVLSGGGNLQNFGPAQTFTVYPADSARATHSTVAPLILTYTSSDPTVFTVTGSDTIQAGAIYTQHGAVLPTGAGTAKLIVSAPGYLPDSVTYTVLTPQISFSFAHNYIGKRQFDVNPAYIQTPSYRTSPLTATITQLHPTVDSLSATTVVIPSGTYYTYFNYAGLNTGADTMIVTAPGYIPDTAVLTVTSQRLYTSGGGLPGTALTTSLPSTVTVYAADTVNQVHYSLDTIAINALSSNSAVIQPTAALIHLLKSTQYVQPIVAYTGPGSASVTYSDSAGVYLPVTTNTVAVTGPSLTINNGTPNLGLRQNSGTSGLNMQVPNNVTGSALVIALTSSDTTVATVPATVTIGVGAYYVYFPVTAHDATGTIQITATATGYGAATTNVQVEQPKFLINMTSSLNTTSPAQTVGVYAEDSHGGVHYANEDVAVTLASTNSLAGTIDSSVVVIPAGSSGNFNARFIAGGQAGTTTISATDTRPAAYRYTTSTQNVAVNTPTLTMWGTIALGIGQYSDQTVYAADYQTSALTVSFAHASSATTTPASVVIPVSSYYNSAVRVTGVSAGTDTVTASATGENSVKGAVVVALGHVDQNSGWPSTLSLATSDSVHVTIYARDASGNTHYVTAATTFNLAADAHIGFSDGTSPITSITIPADQQVASFWIKGTSAGTSTVTVSNANYVTYTSSIVVNP
ncbi:MAG: beta strand repeat-containing protein, partial [Gemmatimonadaceae bacterium]